MRHLTYDAKEKNRATHLVKQVLVIPVSIDNKNAISEMSRLLSTEHIDRDVDQTKVINQRRSVSINKGYLLHANSSAI